MFSLEQKKIYNKIHTNFVLPAVPLQALFILGGNPGVNGIAVALNRFDHPFFSTAIANP